jgi:hypothetical protein
MALMLAGDVAAAMEDSVGIFSESEGLVSVSRADTLV